MKLIAFLFVLFISSFAYGEVSFKDLYRYDLLVKMRKNLTHGQCIDMSKHLLRSVEYLGHRKNISTWSEYSKSKEQARKYCKHFSDNPLCDSLEGYISLLEKVEKDPKERSIEELLVFENANSVSRKGIITQTFLDKVMKAEGERVPNGNCRESNEAYLALKYHQVALAKFFEGDDSLSGKAMNMFDNAIEGTDNRLTKDDLVHLNDACKEEMLDAKKLLLSEYTSSVENGCLDSLSNSGLSVYDKKEIYCSGKTPLACALFKRAPASKK